jgi:hypothetical protein
MNAKSFSQYAFDKLREKYQGEEIKKIPIKRTYSTSFLPSLSLGIGINTCFNDKTFFIIWSEREEVGEVVLLECIAGFFGKEREIQDIQIQIYNENTHRQNLSLLEEESVKVFDLGRELHLLAKQFIKQAG